MPFDQDGNWIPQDPRTPATSSVQGGPVPTGGPNLPPVGSAPVGSGTPTGPAWTTDPQFAGMDPQLQQIYRNSGLTPAGRGTGFADWQYWQGVGPSQYGRLTSDIAGTGSDQPTGTPGAGPWSSSGAGSREGSGRSGGYSGGSLSPFELGSFAYTPLNYTPSAAVAGAPGGAAAASLYSYLQGVGTGQISPEASPELSGISPTDPLIRAQTDAFRSERTNQLKNYLSNLAATSGPNTNISAETRAGNENLAQSVAGFQAQAMQNELTARRGEIAQALSGAQGLLTSEQALQLQDEAKQIDAQLQEMGLAQGESQFERQLAQHAYEFDTNNYNTTYA